MLCLNPSYTYTNCFFSLLFQIPKQRYKISSKTNKVYDLTDRKVNVYSVCLFLMLTIAELWWPS